MSKASYPLKLPASVKEAAARLRRYRHMTPEEFLSARATPSTS